MSSCWNCLRQNEPYTRVCPYCGAAIPVLYGPELPPGFRGSLPVPPAEVPVRREPPRERATFTLQTPADAGPPAGLREVARPGRPWIAAALIGAAAGIYAGWSGEAPGPAVQVDASSREQASRDGLLINAVQCSTPNLAFGGSRITIEEAWKARVGVMTRTGWFARERIVSSGPMRVYFRTTVTGKGAPVVFMSGSPQRAVEQLELERDGQRVVLHFVDAPDPAATHTITLLDPRQPSERGPVFTLQ